MCTYVYTALPDPKAPKYLRDIIKEYTPTRSLRSQEQHKALVIPRSKTSNGDTAFSTFAPRSWNSQPEMLKKQPTIK